MAAGAVISQMSVLALTAAAAGNLDASLPAAAEQRTVADAEAPCVGRLCFCQLSVFVS